MSIYYKSAPKSSKLPTVRHAFAHRFVEVQRASYGGIGVVTEGAHVEDDARRAAGFALGVEEQVRKQLEEAKRQAHEEVGKPMGCSMIFLTGRRLVFLEIFLDAQMFGDLSLCLAGWDMVGCLKERVGVVGWRLGCVWKCVPPTEVVD